MRETTAVDMTSATADTMMSGTRPHVGNRPRNKMNLDTRTTTCATTTIKNSHVSTQSVTEGTKHISLSVISFNCHGFNGMILDTMKYSDFMFLSETWLWPNELSAITNQMRENNYWCVMKSSIDP